jgi:hypothetical protein
MAITGGQLTRKGLLLAKIEATYGVDPTPAAADAVMILGEARWKQSVDFHEFAVVSPNAINMPHIAGARYGSITFDTWFAGKSAGVAPETSPLFKACGMTEATSGGVSVTYTPDPDYALGVTLWFNVNGVLYEMNGAVGTWSMDGETGKPLIIHWEFSGIYVAVVDAALTGSPVFDATVPPVLLSAGMSWDAASLIISKFSLAKNNEIAMRKSVSAATGYQGFKVITRNPEGSFTGEFEKVANHDFFADVLADNDAALTLQIGAAGNQIQINCDKCRAKELSGSSENGIEVIDTPFVCYDNAGDDAVEIILT